MSALRPKQSRGKKTASKGVDQTEVTSFEPGDTSLDAPVLEAAPRLFALMNQATGVAAVLYHHIQHHKLHKQAGHKTMVGYAEEVLGISTKSTRAKFSRAGRAAWECYTKPSRQVIGFLARGLTHVHPEFPQIPSVTALSLLTRALKQLPPEDKPELLDRLLKGDCRTNELEAIAKQPTTSNVEVGQAIDPGAEHVPGYIARALNLMAQAEALFLRNEGAGSEGSRSKQLVDQAIETLIASTDQQAIDVAIHEDKENEAA